MIRRAGIPYAICPRCSAAGLLCRRHVDFSLLSRNRPTRLIVARSPVWVPRPRHVSAHPSSRARSWLIVAASIGRTVYHNAREIVMKAFALPVAMAAALSRRWRWQIEFATWRWPVAGGAEANFTAARSVDLASHERGRKLLPGGRHRYRRIRRRRHSELWCRRREQQRILSRFRHHARRNVRVARRAGLLRSLAGILRRAALQSLQLRAPGDTCTCGATKIPARPSS